MCISDTYIKQSYVQDLRQQQAQKAPYQCISTNQSMKVDPESYVQTSLTDDFKFQ